MENSLISYGTPYLLVCQINEALLKQQMKKAKKEGERNGEKTEKGPENFAAKTTS